MASQPWRMPASTATLTRAWPTTAARFAAGAARKSSKQGTETTRAEILRAARSFFASAAMATSEPVANSDTTAESSSAAISS